MQESINKKDLNQTINQTVAFFSTALILIVQSRVFQQVHDRMAFFARLCTSTPKGDFLVDLMELCLLKILNEKNSEKALEFPVRAFSEISRFEHLTMQDIIELSELDASIMEPVLKKLVRQKILIRNSERFALNKRLEKIHKLV